MKTLPSLLTPTDGASVRISSIESRLILPDVTQSPIPFATFVAPMIVISAGLAPPFVAGDKLINDGRNKPYHKPHKSFQLLLQHLCQFHLLRLQ